MAVHTEIWTGELIKAFRHEGTFLQEIPSKDDLVKHNAIHMVDIGVDPDVLVNNVTYPIPTTPREDGDIVIPLDKVETTNTEVSDDELHAISYDKIGSVVEQHNEVLEEKSADLVAHSLAPLKTVAGKTILIATTGESNGETNARKRLTDKDLVAAKKFMDDLKVPKRNRVLVLCSDHVADLLLLDEKFANQYKNRTEGTVLSMYGFKVHEYGENPKYAVVDNVLTKKAWGAAANPATDQNSSFFFYSPRTLKAKGTAKMYFNDATTNTAYRKSSVGFRIYHIGLPKSSKGFGAIVSTIV